MVKNFEINAAAASPWPLGVCGSLPLLPGATVPPSGRFFQSLLLILLGRLACQLMAPVGLN